MFSIVSDTGYARLDLSQITGVPAIADPGAEIVKMAHEKQVRVVPLVGPSSIIMAMMASGFNGQNFAFNGYLPIDPAERKKKIKSLERLSFDQNQSQIFIETPYRNEKMFNDLKAALASSSTTRPTRLAIAQACSVVHPIARRSSTYPNKSPAGRRLMLSHLMILGRLGL